MPHWWRIEESDRTQDSRSSTQSCRVEKNTDSKNRAEKEEKKLAGGQAVKQLFEALGKNAIGRSKILKDQYKESYQLLWILNLRILKLSSRAYLFNILACENKNTRRYLKHFLTIGM